MPQHRRIRSAATRATRWQAPPPPQRFRGNVRTVFERRAQRPLARREITVDMNDYLARTRLTADRDHDPDHGHGRDRRGGGGPSRIRNHGRNTPREARRPQIRFGRSRSSCAIAPLVAQSISYRSIWVLEPPRQDVPWGHSCHCLPQSLGANVDSRRPSLKTQSVPGAAFCQVSPRVSGSVATTAM